VFTKGPDSDHLAAGFPCGARPSSAVPVVTEYASAGSVKVGMPMRIRVPFGMLSLSPVAAGRVQANDHRGDSCVDEDCSAVRIVAAVG
jgi:hypothetical protein